MVAIAAPAQNVQTEVDLGWRQYFFDLQHDQQHPRGTATPW
jgi:hypothetical protein